MNGRSYRPYRQKCSGIRINDVGLGLNENMDEITGLQGEGDDDGSLTWGGIPAHMTFAGVRKIIDCDDKDERPTDSTEITYSGLTLPDKKSSMKLAKGKRVQLTYED